MKRARAAARVAPASPLRAPGWRALTSLALLVHGCDGPPASGPRFPADFQASYRELRDCRNSHEHELRHIRVFASPSAQAPYTELSPRVPYPPGATLVKLEYELPGCRAEDFIEYTVLHKLAGGEGRWLWQRVAPDRRVLEEGAPRRCVACHTFHCAPPLGYDLTCAEEL